MPDKGHEKDPRKKPDENKPTPRKDLTEEIRKNFEKEPPQKKL